MSGKFLLGRLLRNGYPASWQAQRKQIARTGEGWTLPFIDFKDEKFPSSAYRCLHCARHGRYQRARRREASRMPGSVSVYNQMRDVDALAKICLKETKR